MEVTWNNAMKDSPWEMYPASHNDDTFALMNGGDIEIDPVDAPLSKTADEWQEFNVTSAIKDFIENPENNNGFTIRSSAEQCPHSYFSSDQEDKSKRPKLTFRTSTPITNILIGNSTNGIFIKTINKDLEVSVPFKNPYDIKIFSLNGKKVVNLTNNTKKTILINNSQLNSGINIISINYNGNQSNFKLFRRD